jgi:hypothetical protein
LPGVTCNTTDLATTGISFSENNIVLIVGQSKTINISGNGSYTISNNSYPIITPSIEGNKLILYPTNFGGTAITVCQVSGGCGTVNAVALTSASQIPTTTTTPAPTPAPTPIPIPAPVQPTTPVSTPTQPASTPSSTTTQKYTFSSFLTLNSTGIEVRELQKRLTDLGFYKGPITGTFGPLTQAAVKAFQKARKIDQVGYVGPSTRTALNSL